MKWKIPVTESIAGSFVRGLQMYGHEVVADPMVYVATPHPMRAE